MSYMTRGYLLDKYGPRLTMEQLAQALAMPLGTIKNQMTRGEFKVRTYTEGSRRYASMEAVAEYLEACDDEAKKNPA